MGEFVDDVYLYYLDDGDLVEKSGELYRRPKELKTYKTTGTVVVKVDKGEYRYTVYLQPGVLYKSVYVWFYKPNKRAAAKVFRERLIGDIRHQQNKINDMWEVYDTLENYIH